jgi:di/tricarboxylate transporter
MVLGVMRRGEHVREHLGELVLRVGDLLLVQAQAQDVDRLAGAHEDLVLLAGRAPSAPRTRHALAALVIVGLSLGAAGAGLLPLPFAALLGSVAIVSGGVPSSGKAYRSIDLRLVVILGCMLGVGLAVHKTGLARAVAGALVPLGEPWGPTGLLAAVFLATSLLTEVVTNAGTAGVMVPIAIEVARISGVSPRPFVMAVALAASLSMLTPMGYQTNLLVYGPGGYRLTDYLRLGLPLELALWAVASLLIPVFFPF